MHGPWARGAVRSGAARRLACREDESGPSGMTMHGNVQACHCDLANHCDLDLEGFRPVGRATPYLPQLLGPLGTRPMRPLAQSLCCRSMSSAWPEPVRRTAPSIAVTPMQGTRWMSEEQGSRAYGRAGVGLVDAQKALSMPRRVNPAGPMHVGARRDQLGLHCL